MAIHTEWVEEYRLFYAQHVGSIKLYQVKAFFEDMRTLLPTGSFNVLLDLCHAMYTDELLDHAFDPQYIRDEIGHPNVKQVIIIVPDNHPLRDWVWERYKQANSLHKLRFVNRLNEATHTLQPGFDTGHDVVLR